MLILGIDPGAVSGAWGLIDHNGSYVACGDIPNDAGRIQTRQLWSDLSQAIDKQDCVIWCEAVHSMPGQGVASTFRFGRAVGAIEAVCERFLYPWFLVRPQAWKKHLGLTANKIDSLVLARRTFPEAGHMLKRMKDHGRAEALLIAEYGRRNEV
jgi:Holliday junction resolvasome RuvABC endonuclease subunit